MSSLLDASGREKYEMDRTGPRTAGLGSRAGKTARLESKCLVRMPHSPKWVKGIRTDGGHGIEHPE